MEPRAQLDLTGVVGPRVLTPPRTPRGANLLRLRTLSRLRWLAIAGQLTAVLFVHLGLGFPLEFGLCLTVIAVSAWLNMFLTLRYPGTQRVRNRYAALLMSFDIVQLAVLIYLTGGLQNPFSFLFLAPAIMSASQLGRRNTAVLAALTFACISFLAFFHLPLPWTAGAPLQLPALYIYGVWAALACGLAFMSFYAGRLAQESRRLSEAFAAAQMVHERGKQLSALDGLAAAAAHELGTPLATISLVAKELRHEVKGDKAVMDDLDLLHSQAARCRDILATLGIYRDQGAHAIVDRAPFTVLLDEVAGPHRQSGVAITIDRLEGSPGQPPKVMRDPAMMHALGNLVENASDYASEHVRLRCGWDGERVTLIVEDDGPGFEIAVLDQLGEPYVTTPKSRKDGRTANRSADGDGGARPAKSPEPVLRDGLGLGFFIAKTLLERTGARLTVANLEMPGHGAVIHIDWPRPMIEAR